MKQPPKKHSPIPMTIGPVARPLPSTVAGRELVTVDARSRAILLGSPAYPPKAQPRVSMIIRLAWCTTEGASLRSAPTLRRN
jgi:hypothetical protein